MLRVLKVDRLARALGVEAADLLKRPLQAGKEKKRSRGAGNP